MPGWGWGSNQYRIIEVWKCVTDKSWAGLVRAGGTRQWILSDQTGMKLRMESCKDGVGQGLVPVLTSSI